MQRGTVKWFSEDKGFGFVGSDGQDYFIHYKEIKSEGHRTLNPGDRVCFEPSSSPKGPVATRLTVENV